MSGQNVDEVFPSRESVKSSSGRALGFVFTALVAVIGLTMRALGKRPLNIDLGAESYWIERKPPETIKQQF